jgi:lipopolysaccharide/colanic/teichoic acid biosynthesis glycosyltransferase
VPAEDVATARGRHGSSRVAWRVWKRGLDLVIGIVGLVLCAPVLAALVVLIRLDSTGPAIFRQVRVGRGGRRFTLYKFRGMYADARQRFPELYDFSTREDLDFYFHEQDDPRITRVGRMLRRTSLDELPNLWNVVKGDMSLVGPRPEIPEVLVLYGPVADSYLSVKPGMTCFAGAGRRDEQTKAQRVAQDLRYVHVTSPWVDLRLLVLTVLSVLRRRNVRA